MRDKTRYNEYVNNKVALLSNYLRMKLLQQGLEQEDEIVPIRWNRGADPDLYNAAEYVVYRWHGKRRQRVGRIERKEKKYNFIPEKED